MFVIFCWYKRIWFDRRDRCLHLDMAFAQEKYQFAILELNFRMKARLVSC